MVGGGDRARRGPGHRGYREQRCERTWAARCGQPLHDWASGGKFRLVRVAAERRWPPHAEQARSPKLCLERGFQAGRHASQRGDHSSPVRERGRARAPGLLTLAPRCDLRRMPSWSPALARSHRAGGYDSGSGAAIYLFAKSAIRLEAKACARCPSVVEHPRDERCRYRPDIPRCIEYSPCRKDARSEG